MAKSNPVATPAKADAVMKPMLHLSDEHVPDGAAVGDPVNMEVTGKVTSRSEHSSDGEGGPSTGKSMGIEIHKIKHKKKKKGETGRAGGKDADMQDGAKEAMDAALEPDGDES